MQRRSDLAITVSVFLLGAWYFFETQRIRHGTIDDPLGEKGLPSAVAVFLMAGAIGLAVQQLRAWNGPQTLSASIPDNPRHPVSPLRPRAAFGVLAVYVILLPPLGYLLATLLFCVAMVVPLRMSRSSRTALVIVAYTLGIYIIFTRALEVPLPAGYLHIRF